MNRRRLCTRTACGRSAVATLTYVYADSTAVVGPLATYAEPHCYDLCAEHSMRLTGPRGWDIVRLDLGPLADPRTANDDDLTALVDAVREVTSQATSPAARPATRPATSPAATDQRPEHEAAGRRGHLRMVRSPDA